jgi:hypothetical protein
VGWSALALFGGAAISVALAIGLLQLFQSHLPTPPASALAPRQVALPTLELKDGQDRPAIEAAANAKVHGYGWADQADGKVRIPIERAMELLAQQGWPDKDTKGSKP